MKTDVQNTIMLSTSAKFVPIFMLMQITLLFDVVVVFVLVVAVVVFVFVFVVESNLKT